MRLMGDCFRMPEPVITLVGWARDPSRYLSRDSWGAPLDAGRGMCRRFGGRGWGWFLIRDTGWNSRATRMTPG